MTKYFIVVVLSLAIVACGQNTNSINKDKESIDKVCDTFMKLFAENKIVDALQLLKQNTVMSTSSIDTLQLTINKQMNNYFHGYGKMLSAEFIVERKIKDFIARRFYILRFDKYYLKFDFTLYKTNSGWTVTNFQYDEDLVELFY